MRVLVVGAAGKTGLAVVEKAKAAGHDVTAFVHSASDFHVEGVAVLQGDAGDRAAMGAAVHGQDAVVDTIGGKTPYKATTLESGAVKTIIESMQHSSARRLLVTSMVGEGDSTANTPWYVRLLLSTFLRGAKPDKAAMESAVDSSGLDWVIARPAILKDDPATGDIRVFTPESGDKAHSITREDLAAFLVAQLTSDEYLGRAVTIANR